MTYASVRAAAQEAAKAGALTPHQLAALARLDELLTDAQRQEFTELWRASGSGANPPPEPPWLAPALRLIQQYEGLRLEAYRCPAGVPTIGYGSTRIDGRAVRMGDTITSIEAESLLRRELLELFGPGLFALLPLAAKWRPEQQAALISWAFNVGLGAVEESTLRRRLLAGEDPALVVAQELPRWNKADGKVLEGLTRRRAAEVELFCGKPPTAPALKLTPSSPFTLRVTPHITYGELALGQEARRFHHQYQCDLALELCQFIEKARSAFGGKPAIITSGYRPPAINASVGGATNSEHLYSEPGVGAIDWYLEGVDIYELQAWCIRAWPFSTGKGAPKGFIHTGIRRGRPRVVWDY